MDDSASNCEFAASSTSLLDETLEAWHAIEYQQNASDKVHLNLWTQRYSYLVEESKRQQIVLGLLLAAEELLCVEEYI